MEEEGADLPVEDDDEYVEEDDYQQPRKRSPGMMFLYISCSI